MSVGPRRRLRRAQLPVRRDDVPEWLAKTYDVKLVNGEPEIAGLVQAAARAQSILRKRRLLWREKIQALRAEARDAATPKERNALRLEAARAEVAMREGKVFPHSHVIARSEFLTTLTVQTEQHRLPFQALCFVAWWLGFLHQRPATRDVEREVRRHLYEHW